jgi:hypothetical protein
VTFSGTGNARPVASVTVAARALREASSAAVLARKALRLIAMSIHVRGQRAINPRRS